MVEISPPRDVHMRWGTRIPMRDGVHLSGTLYLPSRVAEPAPVILTMTPYVAQTYHDEAVYYATHGYVFATVDVRGRGNSEGEFHPINDSKDGHDVIEWLAQQSFCNGRIAMWGGSYAGGVQWSVTKERPPHLQTLVPVAAPRRGVDSPIRNNILSPYTMRWLTLVCGRTSQLKIFEDHSFWNGQFRRWCESGRPFKELDSFMGNPSAIFQEWISHPNLDSYWDAYNPSAQDHANLSIPILTITGIYDADQAGALAHYREHTRNVLAQHRGRHYLVIGPWDHAGTRSPKAQFGGIAIGQEGLLDLRQLHLQWYDWVMQGRQKPQFLRNNVAYYVMGAEKWRYADTLEAVTANSSELFLHSDTNPTDVFRSGALVPNLLPGRQVDQYVYDPNDLSHTELEVMVDAESLTEQRPLHAANGKRLIYHSEPFTNDLEVSGFFKFSGWIALDQPDTDFRVWIYEVFLDGSSILLAKDSLRARYRESGREEKLVHTKDPLRYDFNHFNFVSRLVRKGSRLRLVIGPISSIHGQRNHNSGGVVAAESIQDACPVTVQVFHTDSLPSRLYVPIGQPQH